MRTHEKDISFEIRAASEPSCLLPLSAIRADRTIRNLPKSKGVTSRASSTREAPAQAELRPPMVYVKLPKSVLVVFHLFRATKLPLV